MNRSYIIFIRYYLNLEIFSEITVKMVNLL